MTYRLFASYWPNVTSAEEKPFADKLNSKRKVVFSRTLDRAPWGGWEEGRVVRRAPSEELAELKRQPGKDMVLWGSLTLAQSLMSAGLVDEYRLVVCPLVLGRGRPLFGDGGSLPMRLLGAKASDRGVVSLTYAPR